MTKLSVIIPCYNEEANLKRGVLNEVLNYLTSNEPDFELIIVDDGSTDKSRHFIKDYIQKHKQVKLITANHLGKAPALNLGIQAASGRLTLLTDMDQSTPINQWNRLRPYFDRDYSVVIGSRGKDRKNFSAFRQILSWGFRTIRKAMLLASINDTQCGFKAFETGLIKQIFPQLDVVVKAQQTSGWRVSAFDVELLFIFEKLGIKIKEVSVVWEDKDISVGKSRNFIKESIEMFQEITRVKFNDWQGKYTKIKLEPRP